MRATYSKPLTRPLPYEVITGWGKSRRVVQVHSREQAERIAEDLRRRGQDTSVFLGGLEVA